MKEFNKIKNAKSVPTDSQGHIDFKTFGKKSFRSDSFEGYIGIVVVSQKGALICRCNLDNLNRAEPSLEGAYNEHKNDLAGGQVWIYAHVEADDENQYKQPNEVHEFIGIVYGITGKDPQIQTCIEGVDAWYSTDGEPIAGDPDLEHLRAGAILVENPGGGNADSILTFVDIEMIRKSGEPV